MRKIIIGIVFAVLIAACDPLTEEYFFPLLGSENINVNRICYDNNLSAFSDGKAVEEYQLSESTYKNFTQLLVEEDIPKSNKYAQKFDKLLPWHQTPLKKEHAVIIKMPHYILEEKECLNNNQLQNLLNEKGNYYAAYYNMPGFEYFTLFVIDSKKKTLYVVQNTW